MQVSGDLDGDYALALQLVYEEEEREKAHRSPDRPDTTTCDPVSLHRVVDESLELSDPTPDLHGLFLEFNRLYFETKLANVEVKWSPRMTLCAGLCCYEGFGGLCSIRLSKPLLALRPRKDTVQTLLHEMIHAFLFVTRNNKDHDAHGPEFLAHMHRINKLSGAEITVFHSFHGEVNAYRNHWWQCDGPCRQRPPYYGIVKRSMNRAPSHRDTWWAQHQSTCGGTYTKIKEPDSKTKKPAKKVAKGSSTVSREPVNKEKETSAESKPLNFVPFSGTGHPLVTGDGPTSSKTRKVESFFKGGHGHSSGNATVKVTETPKDCPSSAFDCPVCGVKITSHLINDHLDRCLGN